MQPLVELRKILKDQPSVTVGKILSISGNKAVISTPTGSREVTISSGIVGPLTASNSNQSS